MKGTTRAWAGIGLAAGAWVALVAAAAAGPPAAADDGAPLAVRVKAILEAYCPLLCRPGGESGNAPSETALDLEALADDPGMVMPGRPDASPLYQRLLGRDALSETEPVPDAPSPEEIETVRDWIVSLPVREDGCRGRTRVTADDLRGLIGRWSKSVGRDGAADTRFVSLAHLWNACMAPMRLMELRIATAALLGALTGRREALQLETLGEESVLLAVRPGAEALAASGWDKLVADAPLSAGGAVPGDWLAAHVLSRQANADGAVGRVVLDGAGTRAVSGLAHAWTRDVDLVRAAAERGVRPDALKATLLEMDGGVLVSARRLAYGALPRAAWERLSRALDGSPASETQAAPAEDRSGAIDVVLWPDQPLYRPRDLVTFNVRVDKACHLTLINVDTGGKAIVLFPNELEPENLVAPAVTVKVPGHQAGYQFRFDRAGEETVVAICQRHRRQPEGIAYDYERQRFAILGDWRTFLRTASEREKEIRAKQEAEAARRKRRRRGPSVETEPPPVAPDERGIEGRTAITIEIEPGGKAP